MKRKRKLLILVVSLFLVLSAVSSYAKVVGFYNQQTNRTEYYSDYDKDETFTSRTEAEKYDKQLKKEYDDEDIENEDIDSSSDEEKSGGGFFGFEFPNIWEMLQNWIDEKLKSITDAINKFFAPDQMFLKNVLYPENNITVLKNYYSSLSVYIKSIALSVVLLSALWYGFKVYILWKDGSPDENPTEIVIRFALAVALILSCDEIISLATTFVSSVIGKILSVGGGSASSGGGRDLFKEGGLILFIIFEIVYYIQYWKMMLSTIKMGIELFILRLGTPLACVNIINPQANIWNAYISTFIKNYLGICLNVMLMSIGIMIHDNGGGGDWSGLWACSFLSLANGSKELLNQFIVSSHNNVSGSHVMGTAGQIITIAKTIGTKGAA